MNRRRRIIPGTFILLCNFLFIQTFILKAQDFDVMPVVRHVENTPLNMENSTQKLSTYLTSEFKTEIAKFASIYLWIARNIRYDDELAKKPRLYLDIKEVIEEVMKSKSGVCQHYAELFAELSRLAGLNAYVVDGYTIENGKVANVSHAWNIINLSGMWYIVDATWANALIKSKPKNTFPHAYFLMKPEESIKSHMPFDPIWQILSSPIRYEEFDAASFKITDGNFSYNDSISEYLRISMIEQQKATIRRMKSNGIFNPLIKREFLLKEKNLNTSISNQEILKYNQGIKYYNAGMGFMNQYIKLRNNKFKDKKYDKKAILNLIDSAAVNLQKSETTFNSVRIEDAEINRQIKANSVNLRKTQNLIIKELEFVLEFFK